MRQFKNRNDLLKYIQEADTETRTTEDVEWFVSMQEARIYLEVSRLKDVASDFLAGFPKPFENSPKRIVEWLDRRYDEIGDDEETNEMIVDEINDHFDL